MRDDGGDERESDGVGLLAITDMEVRKHFCESHNSGLQPLWLRPLGRQNEHDAEQGGIMPDISVTVIVPVAVKKETGKKRGRKREREMK